MNNTRQFLYCVAASILFLVVHMFILTFKLSDGLNFALIVAAMILTQFLVFGITKRTGEGKQFTFYGIMGLLCLTQFLSVTILTFYSALVESKPIHFMDVLVSIALFVVVLPLMISTVIWFAGAKPR